MNRCQNRTLMRDTIAEWVRHHGLANHGASELAAVSALLGEATSADILMCLGAPAKNNSIIYCSRAAWDSEMLGVRVGRFSFLSAPEAISRCRRKELVSRFVEAAGGSLDLLIGRLDSRDVTDLHVLEDVGFRVMDLLVTLATESVSGSLDRSIRPLCASDIPLLEQIASASFISDHFHADPRLARERSDNLYLQWVRNSCDGRADAILVAEPDGEACGFITCRLEPQFNGLPKIGTIDLIAVAPRVQGRGLGRKLVAAALAWFQTQGVARVEVGTQVSNAPAMRLYQHFGFQVCRSAYTVHGWIDSLAGSKEGT